MASRLLELTADIVASHASSTELTTAEVVLELKTVYATLEALDKGDAVSAETVEAAPRKRHGKAAEEAPAAKEEPEQKGPALTMEEAFQPNQVGCMICGKKGMTSLKRHLMVAHQLKPGQYRRQFKIPSGTPLAARDYVEKRRQMAKERGLGENLAKARAARKQKAQAQ